MDPAMKSFSPQVHIFFTTTVLLCSQALTGAPMRSILVPLDGSSFGESALSLAGEIAERSGRSLELVTVKPPVRHPDISAGMLAEIDSAGGVGARLYLDQQAQELHRRFEIGVHTAVLDGPVPGAIADHVHYNPPDLIVMSTHGRS